MTKDTKIVNSQTGELEKQDSDGKLESQNELVSDEAILGVYGEIMDNIRKDREMASEYLDNFADLVINDGDATNASKEALVNLVKIKCEASDRMVKIADLMTRIKLKERNTMPEWQKAKQNTINIYDNGSSRRELIEKIHAAKKSKK